MFLDFIRAMFIKLHNPHKDEQEWMTSNECNIFQLTILKNIY